MMSAMPGAGRSRWVLLCWAAVVACSSKPDVTAPTVAGEAGNAGEPSAGGSSAAAGLGSAAGMAGSTGNEQGGGAPEQAHAGAAGGAGDAGVGAIPSIPAILQEYRSWQAQSEPQNVSGYIFGLCRLPTLPEQTFADSEHGQERYLQDWVNPEAKAGIAALGAPAFPVGSVIVKEKYAFADDDAELDLVAIGIMIKREADFSQEHADWDYAYWESELGIVQTQEQSSYCAGCHAAAADTDHVYVMGLPR